MHCMIRDIPVYYEVVGEGRPIIMLHGWFLDHHHMMSRLEPAFQKRTGWQRIYLDMPGHGKTPAKPWVKNQDRMLEVVLEVIENLVAGQRFVLAGASAGAYFARGVVHERPEAIDGLLMMVPMIAPDDAKRKLPPPLTLVADPTLESELTPQEAGSFQIAVVQSRAILDYMRSVVMPARRAADHSFLESIGEHPENYAFTFDVDVLPRPCPAPTLMVTGRQDALCGYRDAWDILDNYPRATFAVLDRAGHMLAIEQEGLFQALVGEWLDRVDEYARSQS